MKIWLKLALPLVMLCLVVGNSSQAQAADISGRASTVLELYDDAQGDKAVPIYQYLNLNATNIADKDWNFRVYGRLSGVNNDNVDADSQVYYAYVEKKDLFKNLDLKLGRQFVATTAGASVIDGIYLDYEEAGYNIAFFGGGSTKFDDSYHRDDLVFGAEISSNFMKRLDASVSYFLERDQGDVGYELLGLDLRYALNSATLYNETQYSLVTRETTYLLAGASFRTKTPWSFRTEYLYSLPVFTSTSIYSVFAVDLYQELMAKFNYTHGNGLNSFGRIVREIYESGADATVVEAGFEKKRTDLLSGYLVGTVRRDPDGQSLYGFKAHAAYLFTPKVEAGVGVHVDVIEREIQFLADNTISRDDSTSSRLWVDSTVYITPTINVQGKVEYLKSAVWDKYYRGRIRLNFLF